MNEYIVYTIEDDVNVSPKADVSTTSYGSLGYAVAESPEDAMNRLNEFLGEERFEEDSCASRQLLTEPLRNDIRKLVAYMWDDECRHYEESCCPEDHIFSVLKRIRRACGE